MFTSRLPIVALVIAFAAHQSSAPLPSTAQEDPLNDQQQALFSQAKVDFNAQHWSDAASKLSTLHSQVPNNVLVTKFAAEADLNAGAGGQALSLLKPILAANKDDLQALAISAHAYSQLRQAADRDATLAQLQTLHDNGAAKLQSIVLERDPTSAGGSVLFFYSFEPWSRYNIYLMARVYDASGKQLQRITLESGDFDQPQFAKEHPAEAAKGMRAFSIDSYVDQPGPQGGGTQTHATYAFFSGRPSFDIFQQEAMAIANGQKQPMSTLQGIPMPTPSQQK